MAKVRLIAPEARIVPELGGRTVQPDEVVEVPDERFEGYVCQATVWQPVEEPRTAPAKKGGQKAAKGAED